jgi:hypothetical protein
MSGEFQSEPKGAWGRQHRRRGARGYSQTAIDPSTLGRACQAKGDPAARGEAGGASGLPQELRSCRPVSTRPDLCPRPLSVLPGLMIAGLAVILNTTRR